MTTQLPPLRGLRVLELGELIAGPFIGTLLGEFGAEVIKIERPGGGDILRQFGPVVRGESLFWVSNARNKKSVVLDLKVPESRDVLRDLLGASDVLVNSLRPGTLEGWGFDEERLRTELPRLVTVYTSAYGRRGPKRMQGGYDPVAQGFSGLSYVTGEADGPPMRAGGSIPVCDFMTGFAGAFGAMMSLYERDRMAGGRGQSVDTGLYDVAFRMLGPLLTNHDLTGEVWERDGNHSLGGAPTGHFRTADGAWICTSVQNDQQFARLARLIGRKDWLEDPRFATLHSRTRNRTVIEEIFVKWVAGRTRASAIEALEAAGVGSGPINSMADLSADPHLAERGTTWIDHPTLGRLRVPSVVPYLNGSPGSIRSVAPSLGEHTTEVLTGVLGYSGTRCRELEVLGAIPSEKPRDTESSHHG